MGPQVYAGDAPRPRRQDRDVRRPRRSRPRDRALVQRPPDHGALDPAAQRARRPEGPPRHGSRRPPRPAPASTRRTPRSRRGRTLQPADTPDLGEQVAPDLETGQPHEQVPRRELEVGARADARCARPPRSPRRAGRRTAGRGSSAPPRSCKAADPSTTRSAPRASSASTCSAVRTPPLAWTGTPSSLTAAQDVGVHRPRPSARDRRRPRGGAWHPRRRTASAAADGSTPNADAAT